MLYSVISHEDIFADFEKELPKTKEISINGLILELELLSEFQAKVVRVISSDPQDYLSSHHQPGSIIHWDIV